MHNEDSPPFSLLAAADDLVLCHQYIPHLQTAVVPNLHLLFFNRSRDMINEENKEPTVSQSAMVTFLVRETCTYLLPVSFIYARMGHP